MMHKEPIREKGAICFSGTTAILISILAINAVTLAAAEVTISSTYYCNDGKVIQNALLEDMNYEWNAIILQDVLGGGSMGVPSDCNMGHAKESLELATSEGSALISIDIKGWRKKNTNEDMGYGTGFAAGTSDKLITKWGLQNSGQSTVLCGNGAVAADMLIQLNRMAYTGQADADPSSWSMHARGKKADDEDVDIGIVHSAMIMTMDNFGIIDSTASCTTKNPEIPTQATFLLNSDATSRPGKRTEVSVEVPTVAGDRITRVDMIGDASNWKEPQERKLEVNYFNIKSLDSMGGMGTAIETGVSFVPKMTFRI